jgi:ABC-type iron transport system FetAB ATPase subunit
MINKTVILADRKIVKDIIKDAATGDIICQTHTAGTRGAEEWAIIIVKSVELLPRLFVVAEKMAGRLDARSEVDAALYQEWKKIEEATRA